MNWLFLRGSVPKDRNPKEIIFDSLDKCDDMWTHLFYNLLNEEDYGEIWYGGGNREQKYAENYIERYVGSFKEKPKFKPDIIFARGGFEEYDKLLQKYPDAFKVYYGAGKRHTPQSKLQEYNLTLQDSFERWQKARKKMPKCAHSMWVKPAADNIFFPVHENKEYDICFIANGSQANIKNIKWVYKTIPNKWSVLHLGIRSSYKPPKNIKCKRVLRKDMANEICKCRIGIVPYKSIDSTPRVIPEMLACGIPVIVMDSVHFPSDKYLIGMSGAVSSQMTFWSVVNAFINNQKPNSIREHYLKNLSMEVTSKRLREVICQEYNRK